MINFLPETKTLKLFARVFVFFLAGSFPLLASDANLARRGRATAVSVWHNLPEMTPDKAIDGNLQTRWGAEERHAWYQIEWQQPQTFRGVVMRNFDAPWNKNIPFTCQVWDPSLKGGQGDFRNVQTVTPANRTVVFQFPEVTTTKLRVTNVITFWELEVYDDPKILDVLAAESQKMELAVAGDVQGHLVGALSRDEGGEPVSNGAVLIEGRSPAGLWRRQTTTDQGGLFSVDLPYGARGLITLAAGTAKLSVDSDDLALALTPRLAAKETHLALDGQWDFIGDPPSDFSPASASGKWERIKVPAHWEMEGFVAATGRAVYQRKFAVPKSWREKRIKFRAEGIYSKSEVWLNGHRLGSHDGGATPFELDCGDAVHPGAENALTVLVTDHSDSDDYSAMSFYAHLNLGGIWRPLELFCVEPAHLARLAVETDFDADYRDAELRLNLDIANEQSEAVRNLQLSCTLLDPAGRNIPVGALNTNLSLGAWQSRSIAVAARVSRPEKWSAEFPALYTLEARLTAPGQRPSAVEQPFGFKQVRIIERTYTINGQPVKFWGACRHDAEPLAGRAINKETAWRDIELMKGANLNAMRTSHYPPNPEALNAADHLGIYVEDEAPFCWANQGWAGRARNVVGDLRLAPLAIQLASELVERDRNHPSVSIWSVCNESAYGGNLELVRSTIKRLDPSRPESAGQSANLDIATYHNPTSLQRIRDTAEFQMPVLFDEGFCIFQGFGAQAQGLELDPGLRDYWVTVTLEPLQAILRDNHYLGAMIWAWADDAFLAPGRGYEYGRSSLPKAHFVDDVYARPGRGIVGDPMWGVVDGWRRPRPEYWLAKKLFSPIHIEEKPLIPAGSIRVPVENRNYFLNLDQYVCQWCLGEEHGQIRAAVPPLSHGILTISPRREPASNSVLRLEFHDSHKRLIDGYLLKFAPEPVPVWKLSGQPARLAEQPPSLDGSSNIRLLGSNVEMAFDRTSGVLSRGVAGRHQVLLAGPDLHVMKSASPQENYPMGWHLTQSSFHTLNNMAMVEWNGDYGNDFTGGFKISMDATGRAEISYHFRYNGREIAAREIGLTFAVPLPCDTLNWSRKAEWSLYPSDEIGRPRGMVTAHVKTPSCPRPFGQDDHVWGCNDFRSAKRNIYWASLTDNDEAGIKIVSDGTQHVRATVGTRSISVHALDYYGGSATGTPEWDDTYGVGKVIHPGDILEGKVRVQLCGGQR